MVTDFEVGWAGVRERGERGARERERGKDVPTGQTLG